MKSLVMICAVAGALTRPIQEAHAKGEYVGFILTGTIGEVVPTGSMFTLTFSGKLEAQQWTDNQPSTVFWELKGIPITFIQGADDSFFRMAVEPDGTWGGGAITGSFGLGPLLEKAQQASYSLRIEIDVWHMVFANGTIKTINGSVVRISDHNLK
jgi:hypothetical protein